ncbi:MAG: prolyl oligopeptidase family serine peptidase [Thermoplasmata archaeon]
MPAKPRTKTSGPSPPVLADRRPVVDTYHSVSIPDDYRWLEDGNDREVRRWTAAQSVRARTFLDALPQRKAIVRRFEELSRKGFASYGGFQCAGGRLFALKWDSRKNRPRLVVFDSLDDLGRERVLLDLEQLARPGSTTNVDFFVPSWNGRLVAASLSEGGSEKGDVHLFDVSSGKPRGEIVHRTNGVGGGSLAWAPDGRGFLYVRYPRAGERPPEDLDFYQQVYFHRLGSSDEDDTYAVGKEFPRIAQLRLASHPEREQYLATVAIGDGGQYEHWTGDGTSRWTRVSDPKDEVFRAELGRDGRLYLISRAGAPRGRLLRVSKRNGTVADAEPLLPEREWILEDLATTPRFLFLKEQLGGLGRLERLTLRTGALAEVPLPPVSAIREVTPLDADRVLFGVSTFLAPPAYFVAAGKGAPLPTPLSSPPPADLSGWEVVRDVATSKDGTRVPISLIVPKGWVPDGTRPLLLTGYGGYGIPMSPSFIVWWLPWLESGGLLAVANLRGGGEFGESWHQQGMLTQKQHVFDDFIACAEHLLRQGYGSKDRLGIYGGSNGGLLMGAVLTQRPDLPRAVVADVGTFDMLGCEREPNGQLNVTEFGTVSDPDQFRALYAYSPYHHVHDGTPFPAVLLSTGENDRRVDPMHSRKMAARLQAATGSKEPILLATSGSWGHGPTSVDAMIGLFSDRLAFFADRLGRARAPSARSPDP